MIELKRFSPLDETRKPGKIFSKSLTDESLAALDRKRWTTAFKLLRYVYSFGDEGVAHTQIVRHLMEDLKGMVFTKGRSNYWSTQLYGSHWRHPGLYSLYCEKTSEGKWRLNQRTMEFFDKIAAPEEFSEVPAELRDRYVRGFRKFV